MLLQDLYFLLKSRLLGYYVYFCKYLTSCFLCSLFLFPSKLIFGMAAIPFHCRGVWISPKLSFHRNVSLAVNLPNFYFSFYQKTNFHLYKGARLLVLLFAFSVDYKLLNLNSAIPLNIMIACFYCR